MVQDIYSYRLPGRRPSMWLLAIACVFFGTLGLYEQAPWFIWAVWLPSFAMVLFLIVKNPAMGVRLQRDKLILSAWQKPRDVMLKDIAIITFIEWSDATDMEITLHDGDLIRVFSGDIPPIVPFKKALQEAGLRVVER